MQNTMGEPAFDNTEAYMQRAGTEVNTKLEIDESKRKRKWGRYGIGKYVYTNEEQKTIKDTLGNYIHQYFPETKIEYFT